MVNQLKEEIVDLDVVNFEYTYKLDEKAEFSEKAALSWHLTNLEKTNISKAINNPKNIRSLKILKLLLNNQVSIVNEH